MAAALREGRGFRAWRPFAWMVASIVVGAAGSVRAQVLDLPPVTPSESMQIERIREYRKQKEKEAEQKRNAETSPSAGSVQHDSGGRDVSPAQPTSEVQSSPPPSPSTPAESPGAVPSAPVVTVPPKIEGRNLICPRGYKLSSQDCERIELPDNAQLDYTGKAWECKRGFRQVGPGCVQVILPENAQLDYTGKAWECKRGFISVGTTQCAPVVVPENAQLDYAGRNWECKRGFARVGSACER